jgi:NAD(P)-dependent dehydrogenase (short-subunit alcohol dehydrogenase family)
MTADMDGRTCMITGATSGIGRETAIALARMGATLVLVCRDARRGEETLGEIAARTGSRDASVMLADLSSQAAVRRVAAEFLATGRPLHVLINNAGIVSLKRRLTADGIEEVFAVNHLAYFLLTNLLLSRLKESAPARIVNVASDAHRYGAIDFEDLQGEKSYRTMRIYGRSKLANILFTTELARRLEGTGVTVNCLHPGAVATRLGHNNGAFARVLTRLLAPFFRSPESGAATSIHLASSPAVEGLTGKYFVDCREARPSAAARDRTTAERLWKVSVELTGLA